MARRDVIFRIILEFFGKKLTFKTFLRIPDFIAFSQQVSPTNESAFKNGTKYWILIQKLIESTIAPPTAIFIIFPVFVSLKCDRPYLSENKTEYHEKNNSSKVRRVLDLGVHTTVYNIALGQYKTNAVNKA